jgi:hypothetical protein
MLCKDADGNVTYEGGWQIGGGERGPHEKYRSVENMGGNAIFVNGYNRRIAVRRCHIAEAGASGVAFVGLPIAARNAPTPGTRLTFDQIDRTPGPKTNDYPADCIVEDSLIYRLKQPHGTCGSDCGSDELGPELGFPKLPKPIPGGAARHTNGSGQSRI